MLLDSISHLLTFWQMLSTGSLPDGCLPKKSRRIFAISAFCVCLIVIVNRRRGPSQCEKAGGGYRRFPKWHDLFVCCVVEIQRKVQRMCSHQLGGGGDSPSLQYQSKAEALYISIVSIRTGNFVKTIPNLYHQLPWARGRFGFPHWTRVGRPQSAFSLLPGFVFDN